MTIWIILAVWVAGWAFGTRIALTARMSRLHCRKGATYRDICLEQHGPGCLSPLGAFQERTLTDQVWSLVVGLAWPGLVLARLFTAGTPLTGPEQTRKLREQEHRIEQQAEQITHLHRQIDFTPRADSRDRKG